MTQRYMSMWHVDSTVSSGVLDAFINFYESGFETSQIALNEREMSGGRTYPELTGIPMSTDISLSIEEEIRKLIEGYETPETNDWKILQSYEVAYLDEERYSLVVTMDLVNPRFPRLSMRDMKAMTFDLESGQVLKLIDLLPTEEESQVHLLADVNAFAEAKGRSFQTLDERFENAYLTTEGIVIYTQRKDTGSDAVELLIPNNEIETWIEE
jgi:DNA-directed RNA polymerase subunit H (RpoH/RPB5)